MVESPVDEAGVFGAVSKDDAAVAAVAAAAAAAAVSVPSGNIDDATAGKFAAGAAGVVNVAAGVVLIASEDGRIAAGEDAMSADDADNDAVATMMSPEEVLQNPRFCTWQCKRYILSIVSQHLVPPQELMRLYEIHAAN